MTRSFQFERFDIGADDLEDIEVWPSSDGYWIKAQDALDRDAVQEAKIRTLEVQLKDAHAAHAADKARLDSGCIMTDERDEFGDEYQCERRGYNLRAAIDAAIGKGDSQCAPDAEA